MVRSLNERDVASNLETLRRLDAAWRRSDAIFELIARTSLLERPIDQRHPVLFYVGHLPAFAWNMIGRSVLDHESPRPEFDRLFDFGIDPEEDEVPEDSVAWPSLAEVLRYRDDVRAALRSAAEDVAERADEHPLADRGRAFRLVLEHELMHHETLLYMFQELDTTHKRRPRWWTDPVLGGARVEPGLVPIPPGSVALGADEGELAFGWDNEFPRRRLATGAFEVGRAPVTVGEFEAFLDAGGYEARELWTPAGWAWRERHDLVHPKDWVLRNGRRHVRTMFDRVPIEEVRGWPVCVSLEEAQAYARWKDARLPLEKELLRAARADATGTLVPHRPPVGNLDFRHHSPTPVGAFPEGASPLGVHELYGNGWEWTETPFEAHEGFEVTVSEYAGYSRDFFDGEHFVMLGGSWATDSELLRPTFRNWFRRNYPYPFSQFRLARG